MNMKITSDALIDGRYRYWLTRVWDPTLPLLAWVMLNPSTADHELNDATIRRCIEFARSRGYGGIVVVNLMAFRATKPKHLPILADEAIGLYNARYMAEKVADLDVICAWGAHPKAQGWPVHTASLVLKAKAKRVLCLGKTAKGHPRHPLYIPANQPFEEFVL